VSKRSSTGSVKEKVSSCNEDTVSMKLTYVSLIHAVQSASAAYLTALKMESSSSVNKRPSVGSVKGKVKSCFNDMIMCIMMECSCYSQETTFPLYHCRQAQLFL